MKRLSYNRSEQPIESVIRRTSRRPVRKDHNAGGRSVWMKDFFDRRDPPLWRAMQREHRPDGGNADGS
jgi:hypothetical protein